MDYSTFYKGYMMFGFGKKKFTADAQANIFLNLTLLQSWTLDYRKKDLTTAELMFLAEKIASRMNVNAERKDIQAIALMAISNTNFLLMRKIRLQNNFDAGVVDFCQSLGLNSEWYTI